LDPESTDALERIADECGEIEAVVARLRSLRDVTSEEYVDNIKMLGIKEEPANAKV
jgi:hypothetical protein